MKMHKVRLTKEQLLAFTNMKEEQIVNEDYQQVNDKLISMGMKKFQVNDSGENTTYSFEMPNYYCYLLLLPANQTTCHLNIVIECVDTLFMGNFKKGLVLMGSELVSKIAQKHDADYELVNQIFNEVSIQLKVCGYVTNKNTKKCHRVMKNGKWITGKLAKDYKRKADKILRKKVGFLFVDEPRTKPIDYWDFLRDDVFFTEYDMKCLLDVDHYEVEYEECATQRFADDLLFAHEEVLKTFDLIHIRKEIHKRQEQHMIETSYGETLLRGAEY